MTQHVPEDLLAAFIAGEVGEHVAIHIAEHLDECPSCGTRAAGMEPLAAAFAAVDDPIPPEDLAQAVLNALERPDAMPVLEIAMGASLLAAAALVALLSNPLDLAIDFGLVLHATNSFAQAISSGLSEFGTTLTLLTLLALVGSLATTRIAVALPFPTHRRLS
jgi:anti-sigma factor RsiW